MTKRTLFPFLLGIFFLMQACSDNGSKPAEKNESARSSTQKTVIETVIENRADGERELNIKINMPSFKKDARGKNEEPKRKEPEKMPSSPLDY